MGQVGSAFQNPNTFAPEPSGFSGSEWAARMMGGAAKGLGQGMQNYQQQNSQMRMGGGAPLAPPPAPLQPVQFGSQNFTPGAGTGQPNSMPSRKPNSMFYGYGEGQ